MTIEELLILTGSLWSPVSFAVLVGLTVIFIWIAIAPSRKQKNQDGRLNEYLRDQDIIEDMQMNQSFWKRAIRPTIRKTLQTLGALTPGRRIDRIQRNLTHAGEPWGLSAHDFIGLQILVSIGLSGVYVIFMRAFGMWGNVLPLILARNALFFMCLGFMVPSVWLRLRLNNRRREIIRTFSDALDLLSVGVEAGLAFDSAMLRVCDNWDNALTREFRKTHLEMRVGTPRNVALQRMADRMGIQDISTFVGVLIQSSELGVSIAEVLHSQAEEIRLRRRMRAEELARQAGVKMVFALVFLIFPALLVVLLGPGLPALFEALNGIAGG